MKLPRGEAEDRDEQEGHEEKHDEAFRVPSGHEKILARNHEGLHRPATPQPI